MAGIDEVQLRADDDYAFEGDIADDSKFQRANSHFASYLSYGMRKKISALFFPP